MASPGVREVGAPTLRERVCPGHEGMVISQKIGVVRRPERGKTP